MSDEVLDLMTKMYDEFSTFKVEMNEKVNDLINKEVNDYRIFEDIVGKIDELKLLVEKNHSETIREQQCILENLSEKIAMLMLRK